MLATNDGVTDNRRVQTRREFVIAACAALAALQLQGEPRDQRMDLNTASVEQLMTLPGITRVWAARIVKYRPYRRKDELLDRGVLPTELYQRIEDKVIAHRVKP